MILPDTSAWVAFLRADESPADRRLTELLRTARDEVTVTDPVVMEVLAGARSAAHHRQLRRMLLDFDSHPVNGLDDFESAADVYRRCRQQGVTPRNMVDCLIATVAIRSGSSLLHADRDFEGIARCTELRVLSP